MTTTTTQPNYSDLVCHELRQEMTRQGIGTSALAARLGLPVRQVAAMLCSPELNLVDFFDLCNALGVDAVDLLIRTEEARA